MPVDLFVISFLSSGILFLDRILLLKFETELLTTELKLSELDVAEIIFLVGLTYWGLFSSLTAIYFLIFPNICERLSKLL